MSVQTSPTDISVTLVNALSPKSDKKTVHFKDKTEPKGILKTISSKDKAEDKVTPAIAPTVNPLDPENPISKLIDMFGGKKCHFDGCVRTAANNSCKYGVKNLCSVKSGGCKKPFCTLHSAKDAKHTMP